MLLNEADRWIDAIQINVKKLQFIHSVNGEWSKTAKS